MVYREAVKLSGDKVLGLVFSRFGLRLSRFAAFFVAMVMVSGTLMWAGPQVASAREAQQLSTCLNLATGANRVLVRGVCDLVLEMAQSWDAIAVEEPGVRYFSARTLAHAVLLNTGGDVSRFKKKDWVNLARLQAANRPAVSQGVRDKAAAGDVVRAIVTTCVKNSTGAVRVVNSGECENSVETQRRWVSLEPLQKPVIGQGAPGVPLIGEVSTLGATQSVTVQPPAETGSSPIRSITVIAIPGGLVSDPGTFNQLRAQCTAVWLRADPHDHMQRVTAQGDLRPMAASKEAMHDLQAILASRAPFYAKAHARLDTSAQALEPTAAALRTMVRDMLRLPR